MVVPIIDRIPTPPEAVAPKPLKEGDLVRFVSPASTPDRSEVEACAAVLEGWGFKVDFGEHAFEKVNYLAGTDEQRLYDLNAAIRDPQVRAIAAQHTRHGLRHKKPGHSARHIQTVNDLVIEVLAAAGSSRP